MKIINFSVLFLMLVLAIQVPNKEMLRGWLDKVWQVRLADDEEFSAKLSKLIHDPIQISVAVRAAVCVKCFGHTGNAF